MTRLRITTSVDGAPAIRLDGLAICAELDSLRAIAKLLNDAADGIENDPDGSWDHIHLQDEWQDWNEDKPDIEVYHPKYLK